MLLKNGIPKKDWELSHLSLKTGDELGSGAFGVVRKGKLTCVDGTVRKVAIKVATENCINEKLKELMNEARIRRKFRDKNVIAFFGKNLTFL